MHSHNEIDHDVAVQWSQDVDMNIHYGHYSSDGTHCDEEDALSYVDVELGSEKHDDLKVDVGFNMGDEVGSFIVV